MVIAELALAQAIAACAPHVGPVTMRALVTYESRARANAIGDNTTNRSYLPATRAGAIALGRTLLAMHHDIDVGYAQINSANLLRYGVDVATAFDPCTNVALGARILRDAYAAAARTFGPGQTALAHALSAYNSGNAWAALGYARGVFAAASALRAGDAAR